MLVGDNAVAHAVAEQLARNCELFALMQKPNPGIMKATQQGYICDFSNIEVIGSWALKQAVDLVFIAAEEATHSGLADALQDGGFRLASPTTAAASIGDNRAYARNMLRKHVSFPRFAVCRDIKELKSQLRDFGAFVLKPTIRREWKGLKFAEPKDENAVLKAARELIKKHGSVIVEERIAGEEFTMQALSDGRNVALLPVMQVAKHAYDNGLGPHTEGMASYSNGRLLPFMREADFDAARSMVENIIAVSRSRGAEYKGVLHARFIISAKGVKLVDVEAAPGNPEGINCIGLLRTQFSEVLNGIADGNLKTPSFSEKASVVKYAVPKSYPLLERRAKKQGRKEIVLDERQIWDNGSKYYFEDVENKDGKMLLSGGRAVAVFASGETLGEAEQRVSAALRAISGEIRWRADVATKPYVDLRIKRASALKGSFLYLRPAVKG